MKPVKKPSKPKKPPPPPLLAAWRQAPQAERTALFDSGIKLSEFLGAISLAFRRQLEARLRKQTADDYTANYQLTMALRTAMSHLQTDEKAALNALAVWPACSMATSISCPPDFRNRERNGGVPPDWNFAHPARMPLPAFGRPEADAAPGAENTGAAKAERRNFRMNIVQISGSSPVVQSRQQIKARGLRSSQVK